MREVTALQGGTVAAVPARAIGELAGALGAGRSKPGDDVDPAVGIELQVEVGQQLEPQAALATVHARNEDDAQQAAQRLRDLITFTDADLARPAVVLDRIGAL